MSLEKTVSQDSKDNKKGRTCPVCGENIRSWDDHSCPDCDQCPTECECDNEY